MEMTKIKKRKRHRMKGDRTMQVVSTLFLLLILFIVGYPVVYVISASFSSAEALSTGRVLLWPIDANLQGYQFVLKYKNVWRGFRNSILYTMAGVSLTMFLQICAAYPLSKPTYQGRKLITKLYILSMMLNVGLIPNFLLKNSLGLVGSPAAVILTGSMGVTSVIILRTAFSSIPQEMFDVAKVDGASDIRCLWSVALPLSKATLSTLLLFSIAGNWNEYFHSLIYLKDSNLWPLQLVLRGILTGAQQLEAAQVSSTEMVAMAQTNAEQIRYVLIIVATVPVLAAYGLLQRNFKKGMMVGSVKG